MSAEAPQILDNLSRVRDLMARACRRSGRDPGDVTLVAVTKAARLEWIRVLLDAGVRTLGESRPQQLLDRAAQLDSAVDWHLIGPLQRNKVRPVLRVARLIHSVDSLRLLERIETVAREIDTRARVLLEVNVSGEVSKHGLAPDAVRELRGIDRQFPHVEVCGLMTMAPAVSDPEEARPVFRGLRELRDSLRERGAWGSTLTELSMGMSGDFEVAIEEGASLVRIGSALFEGLTAAD
jgi:pyridoxal phosphate enzyme (YggS family)